MIESLSIGDHSDVMLKQVSLDHLSEFSISNSRLFFESPQAMDNQDEMTAPIQTISFSQNAAVNIEQSVITTNATLNIGIDGDNDSSNSYVDMTIKDSTIVMTTLAPLFDLNQISLRLENVLIITAGDGFILNNSKISAINTYLLSPSDVDRCGTFFDLKSTTILMNGQWSRTCHDLLYKIDSDSKLVYENGIVENAKTFTELASMSMEDTSTAVDLAYLTFSGQTLVKSRSDDQIDDFGFSWQMWRVNYLDTPPPMVETEVHLIDLHHIYAFGSETHLLDLNGGTYTLYDSHIDGDVSLNSFNDSRSSLEVEHTILNGQWSISNSALNLSQSLYNSLQLTLNDAYLIAHEIKQAIDGEGSIKLKSSNSHVALNQISAQGNIESENDELYLGEAIWQNDDITAPLLTTNLGEVYVYNSQLQSAYTLFNHKVNGELFLTNTLWTGQQVLDNDEETPQILAVNLGRLFLDNTLIEDGRESGVALYLGRTSSLTALQSQIRYQSDFGIYSDQATVTVDRFFVDMIDPMKSAVGLYLKGSNTFTLNTDASSGLHINTNIVYETIDQQLDPSVLTCSGSTWVGLCPVMDNDIISACEFNID